MIKLLSKDIKKDFDNILDDVNKSINIICPFIGLHTSKMLDDIIKEKVLKSTIITRFSRKDFYNNASSIEGLKILSEAGCILKAVKSLHTKLYLFDTDSMILGSSNFTNGGLITNIELNIYAKNEKEILDQATLYFNEINYNIEDKYLITKEMIEDEITTLNSMTKDKDRDFADNWDRGKIIPIKKKIDQIENNISPINFYNDNEPTAWLKFEGYSDDRRTRNDEPMNVVLNERGFYRTHSPKNKKPTGYKDGDIIFIARNSWDRNGEPTPIIYGYGITHKFSEKNCISEEEQALNENHRRWPYYIYVEKFKYINTTLFDGISLLDLYREIGSDTFPGAKKRNSNFNELKKVHSQKDKLKITDEAKNYLLSELNARIES